MSSHWLTEASLDSCFGSAVIIQVDPLGSPNQRGSFRQSLAKAFGKRKAHTATLEPIEPQSSPLRIPKLVHIPFKLPMKPHIDIREYS